jgi:hypothetical protein
MKVYEAINAVQRQLAVEGISKGRRNQAQGYNFRGIDDVYNVVSPLLGKYGLCILPRCVEREVVERVNGKGNALFYVTLKAEFDFVSAEDGSKHTVVTYGEAMDSGDKATNKAMSAAYKYAVIQAFAIPTEGDNDADAHSHEVKVAAITEEQAQEITRLVGLSGIDESQLLDWLSDRAGYTISSIKDIPADRFQSVVRALTKRAEA